MLFEFILVCGLFITAIILFLLARKRGSTSQGLLGVLFITTFFFLLSFYADKNSVEWLFQLGLVGSNSIGFLLGPILFLYVTSAFRTQKLNPARTAIHFLPFMLHFVAITLPLAIQGFSSSYIFNYVAYWDKHSSSLSLIENCYLFVYATMAFMLFQKATLSKTTASDPDLSWTRVLLICTLLVQGLDILVIIYELIWTSFPIDAGYVTATSISLSSIYLALHGISASKVLIHSVAPPQSTNSRAVLTPLSKAQLEEHMNAIEKVMAEKTPYLSPSLSLKELSELCSISTNTLSAIINQQTGTTFNDFINGYRVESVKQKMLSKDFANYSLLGMALESGFQSKTSFYRIFKKHTNSTPAEFKKAQKLK